MKINKIQKIKKKCNVYDIEVEGIHSFIVSRCVMHNCIVCGSEDGKTYKSLKDAPVLPRHYYCRCILIPIVSILNYESERASMDGPVSEKVTFEDWLREQSAERQRDVLGQTRYKLFAQGTRIKEFVSDGRVLTLKEFREAM